MGACRPGNSPCRDSGRSVSCAEDRRGHPSVSRESTVTPRGCDLNGWEPSRSPSQECRRPLPFQRAAPAPSAASSKGTGWKRASVRRLWRWSKETSGGWGQGERAAQRWEGLTVTVDVKLEAAGLLQDQAAGEENGDQTDSNALCSGAWEDGVFLTEVEKPVGGADLVGRAGVQFGFRVLDATRLTDIHVGMA